jgi:purine catabolism regulator
MSQCTAERVSVLDIHGERPGLHPGEMAASRPIVGWDPRANLDGFDVVAGRADGHPADGKDGAMLRAFDMGAVVDALPVDEATVAAGTAGMRRIVRRARLAATTEHLRRPAAGDLVVTTGATLVGTGEDAGRLVARLEAAEVAGLAVRLDRADELPPELLAAADAMSLPVITFPEEVALADATAAVLDALLEAQRRRLDQLLDIHQRFSQTVVSGRGVADIATTLHDLLRCPVGVVDRDGQPILVVPTDATLTLESETTIREPIRAGDHDYGAVVVDFAGYPVDDDGRFAMEQAAIGIAVRMAQAAAVSEAQERFAAVSLEELISGHSRNVADVTERALSFGWDLTRPRAVLLASVDPPEQGSIPPAALNTIAAAARATLGPDAIVWMRTATIAALLAPDTDEPGERRQIADTLRKELDVRLRSVHVSIGVGRRVDRPALLARSFAEASRAVEVGRWAKGRHVTEVFDQLGLERLLAATPTDDLVEFVRGAIGPLSAYDRGNNTVLLETLAVWLETRNMAEAARRLFVHYNTMKNRLDRIEAIIGPVVDDAARALECEVAIYVDRRYGERWRSDQHL